MGSGVSRAQSSGYRYGCPVHHRDNDDTDDDTAVCTWVGTTLSLPPTPVRIDAHFHILSVLGTGMLGRVRLVQHRQSRKFFALKSMNKTEILAHDMATHVESERAAFVELTRARLPFLARCVGHFQTTSHLHLVLEYAPGGELRRRLHDAGGVMTPDEAKFYAAELVVFLSDCHAHGFMYRDLKPENVLLDARGHVKVVDLGFVRRVRDASERCTTSVGTPQYLAPEQLTPSRERRSYTQAVDWWALACVVFELVVGRTPFDGDDDANASPFELYTRIVQGRIQWPRSLPALLKDLLKQMLQPDPARRLSDGEAVKRHAWFRDVDWDDVAHGNVAPPFRPRLHREGDRSCFDDYADDDKLISGGADGKRTVASAFRNF